MSGRTTSLDADDLGFSKLKPTSLYLASLPFAYASSLLVLSNVMLSTSFVLFILASSGHSIVSAAHWFLRSLCKLRHWILPRSLFDPGPPRSHIRRAVRDLVKLDKLQAQHCLGRLQKAVALLSVIPSLTGRSDVSMPSPRA